MWYTNFYMKCPKINNNHNGLFIFARYTKKGGPIFNRHRDSQAGNFRIIKLLDAATFLKFSVSHGQEAAADIKNLRYSSIHILVPLK